MCYVVRISLSTAPSCACIPPEVIVPSETATMKAPPAYRSAVALSEQTLEACSAKARASSRKLEDWIEQRLRACLNHDAKRGLYFNDTERECLEQFLGGVILRDASEAMRLLSSRFTVPLSDGQTVEIDAAAYAVLKERAADTHMDLAQIVREAIESGIRYAAWGER